MVGTSAYNNEKHKLYNWTVQAISRGGGYFATKVVALCAQFVDMGPTVKTQLENGLSKLFDLQGQTIDTSEQEVLTLNDSGLHDE